MSLARRGSKRSSGVLSVVAAAFFAGLSRLRGKRIFHPRGGGWRASTTRADTDALPWDDVGTQPCAVRLSRGLGVPAALPDILGIAIRVPDVAPGVTQDLLLASAGRGRVGRHVLFPRRDFRRGWFSSVLPYRTTNGIVVFGACLGKGERRVRRGTEELTDLRVDLYVASMGESWTKVASFLLEERLDVTETERLRFNPWNTHPGLEPAGPLNGLRRGAYVGSQEGRPT